jgi:hypothetical protein
MILGTIDINYTMPADRLLALCRCLVNYSASSTVSNNRYLSGDLISPGDLAQNATKGFMADRFDSQKASL